MQWIPQEQNYTPCIKESHTGVYGSKILNTTDKFLAAVYADVLIQLPATLQFGIFSEFVPL